MDNKKKIALILSILSMALVTLVLISYLQYRTKFAAVSPLAKVTPNPTLEELSTWTDPADFSFQYPKSLSLNPHNEDQANYAHVELVSASHSGSLIIWVKDTNVDTIDGWVIQQKIKNAIDSELAGTAAKKVLTADEKNKITLSAINNGYLYQIEVNPTDLPAQAGGEFWNKIFSQVSSTFTFISSATNTNQDAGTADQGSAEGVSEGEEVIE